MGNCKTYYHDMNIDGNKITNFILNPVTTTERTTIGLTLGPADEGFVVWDTNLNTQFFWDGTQWVALMNGTSGTSGTSGNHGINGLNGTSGSSGSSGSSGITGTSGTTGTSGNSGTSGVNGTSGSSGLTGTSGTTGTSGSSGLSGNSGTSGSSGLTGSSGSSGTSSTSGTSGVNGTSGTSGANGSSGTSGSSGTTGTSGSSGSSGTAGTSGTNGLSSNCFNYQAKNTINTGDPSNGHIIWNVLSPQITATQINVHHINQDGTDIDIFLNLLQAGQKFTIQDRSNSANYQTWQISGAPTQIASTYWTIPVTLVTSGGTSQFTNNQQLILCVVSSLNGTNGTSGINGTSGSSGSSGTTGTSGSSGTSGANGSSGTSGVNGTSGSSGANGTSGSSGLSPSNVFANNITVCLTGGKTVGRYVNGETIPSAGLTAEQVFNLIAKEPIPPTVTLISSTVIQFNQTTISNVLNFAYLVDPLCGSAVTAAVLEWKRTTDVTWNPTPLSTSLTTPNSYTHNTTNSSNTTAGFNYRYTVTDANGSYTVYLTISPVAYVNPSIYFIAPAQTLTSPETNYKREWGNTPSTPQGSWSINSPLVDVVSYIFEVSVNYGSFTTIDGPNSISGPTGSFTPYNDTQSTSTSTHITYRVTVTDTYTTTSSYYTFNLYSMMFYGPVNNTLPYNSTTVRSLPYRRFINDPNPFTFSTGTTELALMVAMDDTHILTTWQDITANAPISSTLNTITVVDAAGNNRSYNLYVNGFSLAYSPADIMEITYS